jgi:UDP-N-acetylglucosamine 3-dehydrogenase
MKDFLGRGMEDAAWLSLEYPQAAGSAWATVETNYFLPGKFREVVVVGSDLSAVCDFNVAQYKIKTFKNQHVRQGNDVKAVEGAVQQIECPPEEPLLMELRAFLQSVQTRQPPRADGWAGFDSVRVLEAAFESAKTGAAVKLESTVRA